MASRSEVDGEARRDSDWRGERSTDCRSSPHSTNRKLTWLPRIQKTLADVDASEVIAYPG